MPVGSSWLDYVAAIGTGVGAVAAALAVIVALFGPGWRAKRKAPKLAVSADRSVRVSTALRHVQEAEVRIRNEPGRDTAEAVEVFVTVKHEDFQGVHFVAREESLTFDTPRPDAPGRPTASVPSGYSRPVSFALFGPAKAVAEHFPPHKYAQNPSGERAALSLCSVERRQFFPWLDKDDIYDVELVVTGANFDAATYRGRIRLSEDEVPVKSKVFTASAPRMRRVRSFTWVEPLEKDAPTSAAPSAEPPRR